MNTRNIVVNRPAVDAGLAEFHAGGDFADGLIAYEGKWLGGDTFEGRLIDRKARTAGQATGLVDNAMSKRIARYSRWFRTLYSCARFRLFTRDVT